MELASSLLLLPLALSLAYLLGALTGRRRTPLPVKAQPPSALSPAQQCEWMSEWFQENAPQRLQPLVPSHVRRHGRHAA